MAVEGVWGGCVVEFGRRVNSYVLFQRVRKSRWLFAERNDPCGRSHSDLQF